MLVPTEPTPPRNVLHNWIENSLRLPSRLLDSLTGPIHGRVADWPLSCRLQDVNAFLNCLRARMLNTTTDPIGRPFLRRGVWATEVG